MKEKTLVIMDPTLKKGFTSTPNAILKASGLSLSAKAMYSILLMFAWQDNECWPGQARLADTAGCHINTVEKYLKELRDYGLISWIRQGLNKPNLYFIHNLSEVNFKVKEDKKKSKTLKIADSQGDVNPDPQQKDAQEDLKIADSQTLVNPESQGFVNQESQTLVDKEYSVDNVVVEEPSVEKCREDNKSEIVVADGQYDITELQQQAEKACGVHLQVELLENLLAKYGIEKVSEKIQMLGSVQTRNAPGFLIAALRDDYILQPGQIQQQQKRASPRKQATLKKDQARGPDNPEKKRKKELIKSLYMN